MNTPETMVKGKVEFKSHVLALFFKNCNPIFKGSHIVGVLDKKFWDSLKKRT